MSRPAGESGEKIHAFAPIVPADARVLVVGTMPSVQSLAKRQYYGHPRNAFWPIMFRIFGEEPSEVYDVRRALLLRHRVALWDVAYSCFRKGSGDAAMREVEVNDFAPLFAAHPRMDTIFFNGGTAESLFCTMVDPAVLPSPLRKVRLPSTSPAHTMPFEEKLAHWREAFEDST